MELQAYVDGELGPERTALLEQHLAGCDGCRAELTRLRAVVTALETWPLVAEPAELTARVMARVGPRPVVSPSTALRAGLRTGVAEPPALPAFRFRRSDFVVSLAGAGLAFATVLAWRYLAPAGLTYLHHTQMVLWFAMLRLESLLLIQRLVRASVATWGLLLGGVTLTAALALVMWDLAVWERGVFSTQESDP